MEVLNGVVSKSLSCKFNNTHTGTSSSAIPSKTQLSFSNVCFPGKNGNGKMINSRNLVVNCGYENKGHLEYYGESKGMEKGKGKVKKGWNEVSTKKRMKLLKGLTKDLSTFSDLGFRLNFDCNDTNNQGLVVSIDSMSSMTISQAAEVLLAQLNQLRAEEEQQKRKEKEEKKRCKNGDCESSSSSSESSDSECDEVVDMKSLRDSTVAQSAETKGTRLSNEARLLASSTSPSLEGSVNEHTSLNSDQDCCNMILETALNRDAGIAVLIPETRDLKQSNGGSVGILNGVKSEGKRIEVCMGGKCKKSGAPALIEEFQKAIGNEGAVVGCKCMGKCKSGPNVKLFNGGIGENMGDDSSRTPSNPLYTLPFPGRGPPQWVLGLSWPNSYLSIWCWFGRCVFDRGKLFR